jgi:agmatine/peptidylarginine deiminase
MADLAFEDDIRLPATYANFLIMNGAVLNANLQLARERQTCQRAVTKSFS